MDELLARHPELADEFATLRDVISQQRKFFRPENGYAAQGGGHLDLYELFCERYGSLSRVGGRLGVVLPRVAFLGYGSRAFRRWLFRECRPQRLDTVVNNRAWAFEIHPQWTVAMLAAEVGRSTKGGGHLTLTGPSRDLAEFHEAVESEGVTIPIDQLASWTPPPVDDSIKQPTWEVPLVPSAAYARVFAEVRAGPRVDEWLTTHGRAFPVQGDFNETSQRSLFAGKDGTAVWKGRSFEQYEPHGREPVGFGDFDAIVNFARQRQSSGNSAFVSRFDANELSDARAHPIHRARVAFRDVSRSTDSRTVRACLVPPRTPLGHSAPYLAFPRGWFTDEAYALALLNSLTFDWQARRFVESHLTFFILNLLCLPPDERVDRDAIAERAARLSCVDERFEEFAAATGVECGPLSVEERERLRAEVDALVAHGYGLDAADLEVIFADFTLNAVPASYRQLLRDKFAEFAPTGRPSTSSGRAG